MQQRIIQWIREPDTGQEKSTRAKFVISVLDELKVRTVSQLTDDQAFTVLLKIGAWQASTLD